MPTDNHFMQRCLELAARGRYTARPNPMVGAVLVQGDRVISEGYHYRPGLPHAEVMALQHLPKGTQARDCRLYVNLEPCSHHGRTPPCADRIIAEGIPEVYVACLDSHAKVNGAGIERMKQAGIKVTTGLLKPEAEELNRYFFTYHRQQRPFITLKWAQSADGFMDIKRRAKQQGSYPISGARSRAWVHDLRSRHEAIAVGTRTALIDEPRLDVRHSFGTTPLRVILDIDEAVPPTNSVFRDHYFIHATRRNNLADLPTLLRYLYDHQRQSLLVEGGAATLQRFIDADLWDEAFILEAPKKLHEGLAAPQLPQASSERWSLGEDYVYHYRKR